IIRKKGTRLTGDNATILTSDGFGTTTTPTFESARRLWFDQGGIFAVANLRGDRELSEELPGAGKLPGWQRTFDHFVACAEFLIRSNYTKPSKLAIEGGGNSGLLLGLLLTQRPNLARAVVSDGD